MRCPHRTVLALIAGSVCLTACVTTGSRASVDDRNAIVAVADDVFEAMRSKDESALRAAFTDEIVLIRVDTRGDTVVRAGSPDAFIDAVLASPDELRERIWSPEVRVDGDLATLWAPYEFFRGDTFSHCGYDAFQLVRTNAGWKIAAVAFTRRYDDCD